MTQVKLLPEFFVCQVHGYMYVLYLLLKGNARDGIIQSADSFIYNCIKPIMLFYPIYQVHGG